MGDELIINLVKWLSGLILSIGIWVGTIEQRLRHKANIEDVARKPVEADTVTIALDNIAENLQTVQQAQACNAQQLHEMSNDVATLMERTKTKE